MNALELFGNRLRALRKARGWSQEKLAEVADIHENYASRLEGGHQEPALLVVLRLCRALEIAPADLLADFTPSTLKRLHLR